MTIEERYEHAVFILRKIAEWDPEERDMSVEQSLNCCRNMAKTFLRYKDITNEGNVITGYPWGNEDRHDQNPKAEITEAATEAVKPAKKRATEAAEKTKEDPDKKEKTTEKQEKEKNQPNENKSKAPQKKEH